MTATPRILSRQIKTVAEGRGIKVVSMDDPTVFGEVLHQLKFSQAIEEGLLSDYRVEIVGVDNPLIQGQIQNSELLRTSNGVELDAETLASHVALAKATKKYDLRRVISFHGRVAGAKRFAADHTEVLSWLRKADRPTTVALSNRPDEMIRAESMSFQSLVTNGDEYDSRDAFRANPEYWWLHPSERKELFLLQRGLEDQRKKDPRSPFQKFKDIFSRDCFKTLLNHRVREDSYIFENSHAPYNLIFTIET